MAHELFGCDYRELAELDSDVPAMDYASPAQVSGLADDIEEKDEETEEVPAPKAPSFSAALEGLETFKDYLAHSGNGDLLQRVFGIQCDFEKHVAKKYVKQCKIDDFFQENMIYSMSIEIKINFGT